MSDDMQTREMVLNIFRQTSALREGHFQLASGRHAGLMLTPAHIFEQPKYAVLVTALIAEQFKGEDTTLVMGLSPDGARFAYELARQLGVRTVFMDREGDKLSLRKAFAVRSADRVILAEEVVASAGEARTAAGVVRQAGALVAGVAAVVDLTNGRLEMGAPLRSAVSMEIPVWEAAACPLCKAKQPLTNSNISRIR